MKCVLHVACMPFVTPQGTQAAVSNMVDATAQRAETHLLVYGHGTSTYNGPATLHRIDDWVTPKSIRSGPSLSKLVLDVQIAYAVRRLAAKLKPDRVIAHHIEAGAATLAAGVAPVFVAHTALGEEIATYLPTGFGGAASRLGTIVEAEICRRAATRFAVSPWLADHIEQQHGTDCRYAPIPWACPAPMLDAQRHATRQALGVGDAYAVAYAGNLDRYQGWEALVDAAARLRPRPRLLIATASDPAPVRARVERLKLDTVFVPLATEPERQRLYAACDVAVVPRATPGGLPVKLLDAMSRGVAVIAQRRAVGGVDTDGGCLVVNNSTEALCDALRSLRDDRDLASRLRVRGRAYVRHHHAQRGFTDALMQASPNARATGVQPRAPGP